LEKAEFNSKIPLFFSNYLIGRKTQYRWNNFTFTLFNVDIGVGQSSVLYLFPIFYIFEKRAKNLKIPVLFLSFITSFLLCSNNSDLLLNMENLKLSIFLDHMVSLICLLLISIKSEILSSNPKTPGIISASYLIESYSFNSMSSFILTKYYQLLST